MLIPALKRISISKGVFVERAFPSQGNIIAKIGDRVEPFTKLGETMVSHQFLDLGFNFRSEADDLIDDLIYKGSIIGWVGNKKILAPFDGKVERKDDKRYVFNEKPREYWLLAGVWGEIFNIVDKNSVLIKTQVMDLHLAASTNYSVAGELIVFPNPSEILQTQYLEKFAKNLVGNIVYVGDFASPSIVKRAVELGVGGILAGSANRVSFNYAKKNNIFLGVFNGFGNISTPNYLFNIIKEFSNRFVFITTRSLAPSGVVRIPMPEVQSMDGALVRPTAQARRALEDGMFKALEAGLKVQIFEKPFFGWTGTVDSLKESSIFVKLDENDEVVEIKIPNFFALA